MTTTFRELLESQRAAAASMAGDALRELSPIYRDLPPDKLDESARRIVGLMILGYDDPESEVLRSTVYYLVKMRHEQGLPLAEALVVIAIPRRALSHCVRKAYPMEDLDEGLERLTLGAEVIARVVTLNYEHLLNSTRETQALADRRYRTLYDRSPIMMHSIDAQGTLLEVNEEWQAVLGYTREEVLGRKSIELMTEASREAAIRVNIPRMLQDGYIRDTKYQFIKKNGDVIDVLLSAIVVKNEDGTIERILGVLRDMTESLKAERELRESEERYRSIVERSPIGKCIHRMGTIVYANPALKSLVGIDVAEDVIGRDILAFAPEEVHDDMVARMQEVTQSSVAIPAFESKLLRADGTTVDVEIVSQPVTYEGSPAIQFMILDISARKRAKEAQLRASTTEHALAAQEEMIRALSCPLIPFGKGALLMPLIGHINAGRATRIVETLAEGVVSEQASIAILDVTGVPNVDAEVADALLRAASVVKLLGAHVILTGIQPGIAKVIVELGIDMSGFTVKSSLRDGLSAVMGNLEWRKGNARRG